MGRIIAIGGGEIGRPGYPIETLKIDNELINMTGKEKPKLCFLPTASNDSELYIETVREHFGNRIGCDVTSIELSKKDYPYNELEDTVLSSDIIYVGGGNAKFMLEKWKNASFDTILSKAYKQNILLSGLSAGAICWFQYGSSDSLRFDNPKAPLIALPCLNFIELTICPHFNEERDRRPDFKSLLKETETIGLGLDNCAALKIVDDKFEIVTSKDEAKAWICRWEKGIYIEDELSDGFSENIDLLRRGPIIVT
ncbi:MAG: Type 1 glutamine amidotransferase-like domain-containing protein [Spirochaetales bacterium]|jgi:dipeptidase E|nr:Type 1 glutamine amidotransferase-like domain-containing protein [Spirochaetales bacterium]